MQFIIIIILLCYRMAAQIDSNSVFYFDNGTGEGYIETPFYKEFPPTVNPPSGFFTNTSQNSFRGNHRRLNQPNDAKIQYYISVPSNGIYSIYYYSSAVVSKETLIKIYKKNNSQPVYSKIFNLSIPTGLYENFYSWKLITSLHLEAGDSSATIEISISQGAAGNLIGDGVAAVKGDNSSPEITFGNRRFTRTYISPNNDSIYYSFYNHRFPLEYEETFYKNNEFRIKEIPIYNTGNEQLIITNYETNTDRFTILDNFPLIINSGDSVIISIKYTPKGEEINFDTLTLISNDANEPQAKISLTGKGTKYYFILNASENNIEPHFNTNGFNPIYDESGTGWINSSPSPWNYPIESGNINSRINTQIGIVKTKYKLFIPSEFSGNYFIEYSGAAGSSNAAQNVTVKLVYNSTNDTILLGNFNQRAVSTSNLWIQIGNSAHFINGNNLIEIIFENNNEPNDFLRADLLRFREAPSPASASTSLDPERILDFEIIKNNNYEIRSFILNSYGETPLVIDSITFSKNISFFLYSNIDFPLIINSINGQYEMSVKCKPFEEPGFLNDTILIYTNIPDENSILKIKTKVQYLLTSIEDDEIFPTEFSLSQNYPNPFNPNTLIEYVIARDPDKSGKQSVTLKIYDILGIEIATLVNEEKSPGNYSVTFDGSTLTSGIYFYQLRANNFVETKKMILMK